MLGHAETLLATMRHLITNERVRLISCPREPPPGPSFMQFAESTIRGKDSPDRQKARDWDGRFARTEPGNQRERAFTGVARSATLFSIPTLVR